MCKLHRSQENNIKAPLFYLILVTSVLLCTFIYPASASTVINIVPASQEVQAEQDFDLYIDIDPDTAVAGAQLDINFDADALSVNNINEGDFFNETTSIFIGGTVDNTAGTANGLFAVTLGQVEVDCSGTFAHVSLTAGNRTGDYTISLSNVILSDASGNAIPISVENTQVTIIGNSTTTQTTEITETSEATELTAASGGGGGGGGDTGESTENIDFKEVNKLYITGNTGVSYTFEDNNNPVKTISYTSLKNAGFISSTIEVLKDVSTTVSEKPDGLIYRNMNIWIGKAGYATESNMEDMKISFAVLKNWVQVNDIKTNCIRMNRYNDGKWQVLETEMTGEDNDFYFFEARTPGFSPFAITADVATDSGIENEPVNAASSYDDDTTIEEMINNMEELSDGTSTPASSESNPVSDSLKLSQNTLLLMLASMSLVAILRRRE